MAQRDGVPSPSASVAFRPAAPTIERVLNQPRGPTALCARRLLWANCGRALRAALGPLSDGMQTHPPPFGDEHSGHGGAPGSSSSKFATGCNSGSWLAPCASSRLFSGGKLWKLGADSFRGNSFPQVFGNSPGAINSWLAPAGAAFRRSVLSSPEHADGKIAECHGSPVERGVLQAPEHDRMAR